MGTRRSWVGRGARTSLLALLALSLVAGCHATFAGDAGDAQGASSAAAVSSATAGADPYLDLAQQRLKGAEPADLLESREASCAAFDASAERQTWDDLLGTLTDSGLSPEDAGYLLALQVRTGCPEHAGLLP